jgi:F0F1-type ATP synthase membrane subunit a
MGQSAAETVKEIEQTRNRLENNLQALEERLPEPATWAKRLIGVAVGGGMGGTMFWFAVRRLRGRNKKKKQPQMQAVIQLVPDTVAERLEDVIDSERLKYYGMGIAGAWLLFKLAELRQLRALKRQLVAVR